MRTSVKRARRTYSPQPHFSWRNGGTQDQESTSVLEGQEGRRKLISALEAKERENER